MKNEVRSRVRSSRFLGVGLMACMVLGSHAGTLTWVGGSGDLWNTTDANWSGDATVFSNGDDVIFGPTTSGAVGGIVGISPNSVTVNSPSKVTFATGVLNSNGNGNIVGAPSILSGALVKNGAGELELGDPSLGQQFGLNPNQYSNGFTSITVNEGVLRYRSRAALGNGPVTLAGGSKFIQASEEGRYSFANEEVDNDIILSGGFVEFPMQFGSEYKSIWLRNGNISGPGGILITGSATNLAISGDSTFTGGITSSGSSAIIFDSYQSLGTGPIVATQASVNSTSLVVASSLPGTAAFPDGVANPITIQSGSFLNIATSVSGASLKLGGDITGAGTLNIESSSMTLILSEENTYSGGTRLNGGQLMIESAGSLGSGTLTMTAGSVVALNFIGEAAVSSLVIDGSSLPAGRYGSSASPADTQDDVNFAGPGILLVGAQGNATTTSLAQTAGANPSSVLAPVTLTATVLGGSPSRLVYFYDGLELLGTSALDGSFQASLTTTLTEGSRQLRAQYEGDQNDASSVSDVIAIIIQDNRVSSSTTVARTSGLNPSVTGATLTFTATVTGSSPTGQVVFFNRDQEVASVPLNASDQASYTTTSLPIGPRLITAVYQGDTENKESEGAIDHLVNPSAGNGKLKVFILSGELNMHGAGEVEFGNNPDDFTGPNIRGGLGSLRRMVNESPARYHYLSDATNPVDGLPGFSTRDDVRVTLWGNGNNPASETAGERRGGILDTGFGVGASLADNHIGPEYGFGQVVGAGLDDDVLIIKVSWGGRSLFADFRPPSSGGITGPNYLALIGAVNDVLSNISAYSPGYTGSDIELVGFGWHQGWSDRINSTATAEYEANMANFIRDLRNEIAVPNLPIVIANTGLANAPSGPGSLIEAQGNVSDPVLYPEFAGTVFTVDTRPFDYGQSQGATDQDFRWYGNGESYYQIGEAMGEAMLLALIPTAFEQWATELAQGLTAGVNDGAEDDPDFDGVPNFLEFVLGGDPLVSSAAILPDVSGESGGTWTVEYDRNAAAAGVSQIIEYSYDLDDWVQVVIPPTSSGTVTITPGANSDRVRVSIPAVGNAGFIRLVATQ